MTPRNSPPCPHGFSLIELVTVVLIIVLIAAVAIPRLIRGSRTAGAAALKRDLAALRTAIELYAAEHACGYKTLAPKARKLETS